jgi:hypothetical protein
MKHKIQDETSDLEDRVTAIEIDRAVDDGIHKIIRTVCITATGSFLSLCYWFGDVIYQNSSAVEAAVRAFWIARKGSGHD